MKKIVLAGGCFWGVEEFISRIDGIVETKVGYANGTTANPTYEEVCSGSTGHTEACYITYDETKISLTTLLDKYWEIIDPTSFNKQGNDIGSQYRTGIYYIDENDKDLIMQSKTSLQKNYTKDIVTEVMPLKGFYAAEEYHQKYLKKNPNGYCHIKLD
ncbi:peptide-methionine (S)-S-oxide reductase MsrA [Clostridium sp. YIM B02555]|uniref:peptide-methionine (S)-S-oxide reductase MsrA n=1 Tax=Clostridium sp. YIM B02555 TaxID=2911968 RepID=UPI001EEF35A0|nr:peptide-methionine (S)-S-oxide reductase MsrA [Clostridium sp. YIM B02555]